IDSAMYKAIYSPIYETTDSTMYKASNKMINKNYQSDTSHDLIFDTDSSDTESDSSFNVTLDQTFHTWDDAKNFLNRYELEKRFSIRRKHTKNQIVNNN
ncbi:7616_t:CDS:2, partial [Gigaspora margarita]